MKKSIENKGKAAIDTLKNEDRNAYCTFRIIVGHIYYLSCYGKIR
jgi:hypothetical protein